MKNIAIITFLIFSINYPALYGQVENRFSIGPRVGINIANINNANSNSVTDLTAGITSTYSINEKSGITVDALYSKEGYQTGSTYNLEYLRVPILYNVFFGKLGDSFRPKIYVGLAPGFLLSAKQNKSDISPQYKSAIVDLAGGLGFNYRLANRVWLNADVRAYLGVGSITTSGDLKNRTAQLSIGIAYGL